MASIKFGQLFTKKSIKPGLVLAAMLIIIVSLFVWTIASKDDVAQQITQPATEKFVVEITDTGYLPQTLEIPVGATVEWVNKTNEPHRIAANPQPDHSSFPALDSVEPIGPDATYSFTFSAKGTYVYNNHYVQTENNGEVKVNDVQAN
ncbi:MAG: cupredoxin domain-containing protein [Candidatus Saccharibacteria bacterium]|nr:cupredoxin domain-containing protein [Candidatus Saccharibacteria bacterium]